MGVAKYKDNFLSQVYGFLVTNSTQKK